MRVHGVCAWQQYALHRSGREGEGTYGGGVGSASGNRRWSGCGGSGGLQCFVSTVDIVWIVLQQKNRRQAHDARRKRALTRPDHEAFEAKLVRTGRNEGTVDDRL